jgi:DNA-binding helix-hairpin-helix protein with protein kinase domain
MQLRRRRNMSVVQLGRALGKGGEGTVFQVRGVPGLVAKIYRKPPSALKVEKLAAMTGLTTPALLRVAAWPVDLLMDDSRVVRGFLMPKVTAREDVHELYSPKSRRQAFPQVDFRFVVRVAANIARAFALMHALGHVLGDVNHGNALVGHDGTVVLIDCDSFQIRDRVRTFTCDVGVPLFTAPELQGKGFRGLRRSVNHDAFGLAVLVFHLLFLGRHPFAGRHASGEMPIERAIAESRFAYGSASAELGMSAPPGTLPVQTFGPAIAALFERAFASPGGAERPAATAWIDALERLERELVPCPVSRLHFHPRASACCWCDVESRTAVRLFGEALPGTEILSPAGLAKLWHAIVEIPRPAPERVSPKSVPAIPAPNPWERFAKKSDRILLSWVLVFFGIGCLLVEPGEHVFLFFASWTAAVLVRSERAIRYLIRNPTKARRELALAEQRWLNVKERWHSECSVVPFERLLTQLAEAREKLSDLSKLRETHLRALEKGKEAQALARYLAGLRIDSDVFQYIGPDAIAKLASHGIETAADVAREDAELLKYVDQRGVLELRAWHDSRAARFQIDSHELHDPRALDELVLAQQEQLLTRLREGPALLQRKLTDISLARSRLQTSVDEAWEALVNARRVAK